MHGWHLYKCCQPAGHQAQQGSHAEDMCAQACSELQARAAGTSSCCACPYAGSQELTCMKIWDYGALHRDGKAGEGVRLCAGTAR